MSAVASLLVGIVFGLALQKAGLGRYETIVDQFRLKDFTMLKFMLSAIAAGAVGTFVLRSAEVLGPEFNPAGYLIAALVGGLLLGAGMAVAGTCPGTIFAGMGQGGLDYLVPGVLGMVAGSFVFGMAYDAFMPQLRGLLDLGRTDLAQLLGVNPWLLVGVIVACVVAFWAISTRHGRG